VQQVLIAFTRQASELVKQRAWTVNRWLHEREQFLLWFTTSEYEEIGDKRISRQFGVVSPVRNGSLLPEIEHELKSSKGWIQSERELRKALTEIEELLKEPTPDPQSPQGPPLALPLQPEPITTPTAEEPEEQPNATLRPIELLRDPRTGQLLKHVSVSVAAAYSRVTVRHIQRLMTKGRLGYHGKENHRRPLVEDLIKQYPPDA
jgi:hypothetical protein